MKWETAMSDYKDENSLFTLERLDKQRRITNKIWEPCLDPDSKQMPLQKAFYEIAGNTCILDF